MENEELSLSQEEAEALAASGLKENRKIEGKLYKLVAVALPEDQQKLQQCKEQIDALRSQGASILREKKTACWAFYRRVE